MKETQADKILKVLQEKNGEWINGRYFNTTMMISQFHTRIHELQKRGHNIQASPFTDEYGFKSYRLVSEALPGGEFVRPGTTAVQAKQRIQTKFATPNCCPSYKIFKVHARDCEKVKVQTLL